MKFNEMYIYRNWYGLVLWSSPFYLKGGLTQLGMAGHYDKLFIVYFFLDKLWHYWIRNNDETKLLTNLIFLFQKRQDDEKSNLGLILFLISEQAWQEVNSKAFTLFF